MSRMTVALAVAVFSSTIPGSSQGAAGGNTTHTCTNLFTGGSVVTITNVKQGTTHTILHNNPCPTSAGHHKKKAPVYCTIGPTTTIIEVVDLADSDDAIPPSTDTSVALDVLPVADATTDYIVLTSDPIVADPDICP
jgi:hypothetical protein